MTHPAQRDPDLVRKLDAVAGRVLMRAAKEARTPRSPPAARRLRDIGRSPYKDR